MNKLVATIIFTTLTLSLAPAVTAQFINSQDLLGSEVLNEKSRRGNVRLGRGGARYSGVVIEVPGSAKIIKRVTVQFEDRSSESFNESRLRLRNGRSEVLWFRSRDMIVDRVSLLYFPDAGVYKGTEIRVFGVR